MSEKIEPALTAEEWAEVPEYVADYVKYPDSGMGLIAEISYVGWVDARRRVPFCIAVLNAALPDSDPRKITRARVDCLRALADWTGTLTDDAAFLEGLADALESYLPPTDG